MAKSLIDDMKRKLDIVMQVLGIATGKTPDSAPVSGGQDAQSQTGKFKEFSGLDLKTQLFMLDNAPKQGSRRGP